MSQTHSSLRATSVRDTACVPGLDMSLVPRSMRTGIGPLCLRPERPLLKKRGPHRAL